MRGFVAPRHFFTKRRRRIVPCIVVVVFVAVCMSLHGASRRRAGVVLYVTSSGPGAVSLPPTFCRAAATLASWTTQG